MEMLVAVSEQERYDNVKRRVGALLGPETTQQYMLDLVMKARHLYVHRGKDVPESELPIGALALALACVFRYAEVASMFANKDALLKYLNLIYAADEASPNWSEAEQQAFGSMVLHERVRYDFPFWKGESSRKA